MFFSFLKQKLKGLYNTALNDAVQEEELLRQALTKITEIRNICNERKLKVIAYYIYRLLYVMLILNVM